MFLYCTRIMVIEVVACVLEYSGFRVTVDGN
jgi:hypothetical protein